MLTGKPTDQHGIVGNGWYWRETGEVRFWLQSNRLIQGEPLYQTAKKLAEQQGQSFRCAKLFWWFNQGADVDISVTPKPHYGSDGNKVFDITGTPDGLSEQLQRELGPFPFHTFWGPMAGFPSTRWIGECAANVLKNHIPDLTLVYLPHLDYDTQRENPKQCNWAKLVGELDEACAPVLDVAKEIGARVWVVNEYTHIPVSSAVYPNRELRKAGFLQVRNGPFGEMLDTFNSRAFAVCDHQVAHVYVRQPNDIEPVRETLGQVNGVATIYAGEQRSEVHLNHHRSGELVVFSRPDAWFAYPYWLDDKKAPDFARTVNIHAKPGYDPCELFFDPQLLWPKGRAMWRLIQKKMGFRTLFDVVPLDTRLVRGSHGLLMEKQEDRPVMIGDGPAPEANEVPMTGVKEMVLATLGLSESE